MARFTAALYTIVTSVLNHSALFSLFFFPLVFLPHSVTVSSAPLISLDLSPASATCPQQKAASWPFAVSSSGCGVCMHACVCTCEWPWPDKSLNENTWMTLINMECWWHSLTLGSDTCGRVRKGDSCSKSIMCLLFIFSGCVVSGDRHRRCHDPQAAVRDVVQDWTGGGGHIQQSPWWYVYTSLKSTH